MGAARSENKMKIPKIVIKYAPIYDRIFAKLKRRKLSEKQINYCFDYAEKFEKEWNKKSTKILATMSEITGIRWPVNQIDVYVSIYAPNSFSHPLTVNIFKNHYHRIAVLIHELSHVIFWDKNHHVLQTSNKKGIFKKYANEDEVVKIHIPAEALAFLTIKKVFKKNYKKYVYWETHWWKKSKSPTAKLYRRSWEIMQKEGPRNIIKDVVKQWKEKN